MGEMGMLSGRNGKGRSGKGGEMGRHRKSLSFIEKLYRDRPGEKASLARIFLMYADDNVIFVECLSIAMRTT
jgi:hypothetical protein